MSETGSTIIVFGTAEGQSCCRAFRAYFDRCFPQSCGSYTGSSSHRIFSENCFMKSRSIGIRDVAQRASASIASVSRALNNPDAVRPDLRQRIDAAIAELGYIPDAAARALSSRRSRTIGAIIPTVDNAMFARGIEALQGYLSIEG